MFKLSNGVEISEETVISALKKSGICVEPKHVWAPGDVAYVDGDANYPVSWRLIISINGELKAANQLGWVQGDGSQKYFERNGYKFVGRQLRIC